MHLLHKYSKLKRLSGGIEVSQKEGSCGTWIVTREGGIEQRSYTNEDLPFSFSFKKLFWFCLVFPSFYLFVYVSFLSFFFLFTMHFLKLFLFYLAFFPSASNFSLFYFLSIYCTLFTSIGFLLSINFIPFPF